MFGRRTVFVSQAVGARHRFVHPPGGLRAQGRRQRNVLGRTITTVRALGAPIDLRPSRSIPRPRSTILEKPP